MALRVLHTIDSLHPDTGGPARTVTALSAELVRAGVDVEIVTRKAQATDPALHPAGVRLTAAEGTGLRGVRAYGRTLYQRVQAMQPHVIHDHGLWLPTNVWSAVCAAWTGTSRVVTPRGMLEPWALQHGARKKRVAWHLYQRYALQQADQIHVTSTMEKEHVEDLGLSLPVAVVPNGVVVPDRWPAPMPREGRRRALFLSRLHPKKGLPLLLRAWAEVAPAEWELVLAGPDDGGHATDVRHLIQQLDLRDQVSLIGPVDDTEKWAWYQGSDLFVLPTHSENFGVVVPEALLAGTPVLTTTGAPWRELQTHRCGWWVEPTVPKITTALRQAIACSDAERAAMGRRGQALVDARYAWPAIAAALKDVYARLAPSATDANDSTVSSTPPSTPFHA